MLSLKKKNFSTISENFSENKNEKNEKELNQELEKAKSDITKLCLLYINKYGFTENNMKISANELGYSNMITGIFPNGPIDILHNLMDGFNDKLKTEIIQIKKDENLSVDDKVKKAMKLRLCYLIPFIKTWSQAINIGLEPGNILNTVRKLNETMDLIMSIKDDKFYDVDKEKLQSNMEVIYLWNIFLKLFDINWTFFFF